MNVRKVIQPVFQFFTVFLAGLICYIQYQYYAKSHDFSVITYRKFNTASKDIYPSFSVCLYSSFGMIFKHKNILGENRWKGWTMQRVLNNLYRKALLGEGDVKCRFKNITFEEATFNLLDDIVHLFRAFTKQGLIIEEWNRRSSGIDPAPLINSYQDPNQICISRKRSYVKDLTLNYETLMLDVDMLYKITADLHIYIHKPGELTRILHKPTLSFSLNDFKDMLGILPVNNHHYLRINYVEMIRDRSDAIIPTCNSTLFDDDVRYRDEVMRNLRCVPSYWKRFLSDSKNSNPANLSDCVHTFQLRQINKLYLPDLNVENATKLYLRSCNQMKTIISTTTSSVGDRKNLVLQFDFVHEEYKVSQNNIMHPIINPFKIAYFYITAFQFRINNVRKLRSKDGLCNHY